MIAAQFTKYEKNHNLYDQDKTAHPTDELHRFIDINNTGHQHNTVCGKGSDDAAKYCRNKINEQHLLPDFATCSILTIEKNVENTAFGLYFFNFML